MNLQAFSLKKNYSLFLIKKRERDSFYLQEHQSVLTYSVFFSSFLSASLLWPRTGVNKNQTLKEKKV